MIPFAGHAGIALIIAFLLKTDPLITVIGSILPDLDSLTVLFKIKWTEGHRKITHSLLFLTPFIILSIINPLFTSLLIGVITHYISDLDSWGIPLLYPFSNKYYSIVKVNHSKSFDKPEKYINEFFKKRGLRFYIEWLLLIIGIILNWSYITNLIGAVLWLY